MLRKGDGAGEVVAIADRLVEAACGDGLLSREMATKAVEDGMGRSQSTKSVVAAPAAEETASRAINTAVPVAPAPTDLRAMVLQLLADPMVKHRLSALIIDALAVGQLAAGSEVKR
jgi:hypothetical protein